MSFSYSILKEEEVVIIYLEGNLIANHQIDDLQNELDFQLNDEGLKLVLDLSKMEYMNSTGLGVLIHIFTQVRNNGGEVVFNYLYDDKGNNIQIKPNAGDMLVFLSNPYFTHEVLKVRDGCRISLVQWHDSISR